MRWFFLFLGLAFVTQIWLCVRVGKSSVPLAIVTLLIGFPGALYSLFTNHGDDDTTVTVPFVVNVAFMALLFGSIWYVVLPALDAQEAQFRDPAVEAVFTAAKETPIFPVAPPASAAPPSAADPVDAFAAALRSAGLRHHVSRAVAGDRPAGTVEAANFSVTALALPGQRESSGAELPVTLYQCATASDCRRLAAVLLQQDRNDAARLVPNGLLLLSVPVAQDGDLTPAAVTSAFRKL